MRCGNHTQARIHDLYPAKVSANKVQTAHIDLPEDMCLNNDQ